MADDGLLRMTQAVSGSGFVVGATSVNGVLEFDATGSTAGSLTLNGGTLLLGGAGASLAVGTTITLGTGTILGRGTFTGAVNAGTSAGDITASGGTLEMAGPVTGSALILATTTNTDTLRLDVAGSDAPNLSTINYINVQAPITRVVIANSAHLELYDGSTDLGAITLGSAIDTSTTFVNWHEDTTMTRSVIGGGVDIYLDGQTPPSVAGAVPGQVTPDTTPIDPFAQVAITDPNAGQTETASITLSNADNGTLVDPNAASDGSSFADGVYTNTGTAAAVAAAADGLVFRPTAQQVPPGQTVTTTFTISDTDTAGGTASDSATAVIVMASNVTPPVATAGGSASYSAGSAAVTPDVGLTIGSSVATSLTGTTVSTGSGFLAGDELNFTTQNSDGAVAVWAATSAVAGGSIIALGGGSSLLLPGVDPAALQASNFVLT
jgi:plastocyanin